MHNGGSVLFVHESCGRAGGSLLPELWTFAGMGEGELRIAHSDHPVTAGMPAGFAPASGEYARLRAGNRENVLLRDEDGYDVVVAGKVGHGKAVAMGHYPGMSSDSSIGEIWSQWRPAPLEGAELKLLTNSINWLAQDTGMRDPRWKSIALRRALRRERAQMQPIFENITDAYGMQYYGYGKSVAMADINQNGRLDIFATLCIPSRWPWATIDKLYHNLLYRNDGDWNFTETAEEAGVVEPAGIGSTFGDLNRNGHLDLFVSFLPEMGTQGRSELYFGDGRGGFRQVTDESGLGDVGTSAFSIMADVNNNGHLDLYIIGYGAENQLFINNGDGTFADKTEEFGLIGLGSAGERGYGGNLAAAMADLDGNGYVDLVAFSQNYLRVFRNPAGQGFEEVTEYMGPGEPLLGGRDQTLGLTLGDINHNGRLDIYIAGLNVLLRNDGEMRFTAITAESGLEPMQRNLYPYGPKFVDWNNSGHLDLFLASGTYDSLTFQNNGDGTFKQVTATVGLDVNSVHGFNFGDLDGDGTLDFYSTAWAKFPSKLLRNNTEGAYSLIIDVKGRRTNPSGIGAQISVYEETADGERVLRGYREVRSGGECMYSGALLQQHVGLGSGEGVYTVETFFPVSGERVVVSEVSAPARLTIEEPDVR